MKVTSTLSPISNLHTSTICWQSYFYSRFVIICGNFRNQFDEWKLVENCNPLIAIKHDHTTKHSLPIHLYVVAQQLNAGRCSGGGNSEFNTLVLLHSLRLWADKSSRNSVLSIHPFARSMVFQLLNQSIVTLQIEKCTSIGQLIMWMVFALRNFHRSRRPAPTQSVPVLADKCFMQFTNINTHLQLSIWVSADPIPICPCCLSPGTILFHYLDLARTRG